MVPLLRRLQQLLELTTNINGFKLEIKLQKLQIWDTAGQERFRNITACYYRGAHGVVLVFDLTDPSSFKRVQVWMNDIKRYSSEHIPVLLVGNKHDLVDTRVVDYNVAKAFADQLGVEYMETSAKTGQGVEDVFQRLANVVIHSGIKIPTIQQLQEQKLEFKQKPDTSCCTIV